MRRCPTHLTLVLVAICVGPLLSAQTPQSPKAYSDFAFAHDGMAARGKDIFTRLACGACHSIDGKGGKAGPDLVSVGDALPRKQIIEAILTPSASIAVGYEATLIETKAGKTSFGVVKGATAEGIELL